MIASPQVVFGSGHIHITQIKDAQGNLLTPPQVIAAPAVTNVSADFGKADVKTMTGQREFAIHAAQGKKSTEISFECGELYVQMLNSLYFGQTVMGGSHAIYRDAQGTVLPESYSKNHLIYSKKALNLSAFNAHSSAADAAGTALNADKYSVTNGVYIFDKSLYNTKISLTYSVKNTTTSGVTTVTASLTVPAILSVDVTDLVSISSLKIDNTTLGKDPYNSSAALADNHYMLSPDGLLMIKTSLTGSASLTVTLNNVRESGKDLPVKLTLNSLPADDASILIDPPASAKFKADHGVSSAGIAMTKVTTAPATGQYSVDATGRYTFAAVDNGKKISISYTTTVMFYSVTPPNNGSFVRDKGVRNSQGLPLTRVISGDALLPNQYAVTVTGSYYFDDTAFGEKYYLDYEYKSTDGATLVIQNNDMGSTPLVAIDISGKAEGQEWLISYPKAVPKAFGFATKLDDFGSYKITYEVIADRVSGEVGTVYMTA